MSAPSIPYARSITAVGSRVKCNPPPIDTDRDWLVLVDQKEEWRLHEWLSTNGWSLGGSLPDDENNTPSENRFMSFTHGIENLIVTNSAVFHRRFIAATAVAKLFNLMDKDHRIALFQAVLYANKVDPWKFDPWSAFQAERCTWEPAP